MNTSSVSSSTVMEHYPDINRRREDLRAVLDRVATPVFLGERANLEARYRDLQQSLAANWSRHVVGYSFKTNYLVAQSGVFKSLGAWAEVVSAREYELARDLGYAGPSIVFNGPWKPDDSLRRAIADGALIHVNDRDELDRINSLAAQRGAAEPLEIGLRVSSNLPRLGHSRFGFSLDDGEAASAVRAIRDANHLRLVSFHMHLYGDTDNPEIYRVAAERVGQFAQAQVPDYQRTLKFLDMGGGYPAHSPKPKSREVWDPQPIDVYIRSMTDGLRPFFPTADTQPTLIVEPGRYLTCDAILLVTRVIHVKQRDDRQVVNCDGSISMVPLTHYCPQIILAYDPQLVRREGEPTATIIHGSTCRENDMLYQGPFPRVRRDDYLVHFAAGAYNSSLSPDFIFASPAMKLF